VFVRHNTKFSFMTKFIRCKGFDCHRQICIAWYGRGGPKMLFHLKFYGKWEFIGEFLHRWAHFKPAPPYHGWLWHVWHPKWKD